MKKPDIITTGDGSHSLFQAGLGESYHSVNGAVQESRHVFIENGLSYISKKEISIFEMGFGTGLNAFLTLIYAEASEMKINYEAVELFPLDIKEASRLNYPEILDSSRDIFMRLHESPWGTEQAITSGFSLVKMKEDISGFMPDKNYDLIYFDAFSADVQPHLWEKTIFIKLYEALNQGGVLTTYSSRGVFRRTLEDIGFKVEKIPGPPGKRHITRAVKSF
jgi:tRNA U34 5-methylaminomethyl-2-thiouridine-forming methyltransferase MnmC